MSKTRRPPEILRKSHAHLDRDERARAKRELLEALEEATGSEDDPEGGGSERPADDGRPAGDDEDGPRE